MPVFPPRENTQRLIRAALWIGSAMVVAYHLVLELSTITLPEPMGLWETVYASIARTWPNQYQ
jgi:hypothetical protein